MNTVVHGAKAGGGEARKPVVAIDSAQSKTYIKILYGLSEGPIKGLVNGIRSIYLDDTPLQDANGIWNFNNADIRIYRAKGIIFCRDTCFGQCIKQGGFTNIGNSRQ